MADRLPWKGRVDASLARLPTCRILAVGMSGFAPAARTRKHHPAREPERALGRVIDLPCASKMTSETNSRLTYEF